MIDPGFPADGDRVTQQQLRTIDPRLVRPEPDTDVQMQIQKHIIVGDIDMKTFSALMALCEGNLPMGDR